MAGKSFASFGWYEAAVLQSVVLRLVFRNFRVGEVCEKFRELFTVKFRPKSSEIFQIVTPNLTSHSRLDRKANTLSRLFISLMTKRKSLTSFAHKSTECG